jgi:hypothetical protein
MYLTIFLVLLIILLIAYGIYQRRVEHRAIFEFIEVWTSHLVYTRLVFMEFLNGGPELEPLKTRLLQNQIDIGTVFGKYYGKDNGDKLTNLLTQHIVIAVKVLSAVKDKTDPKAALAEFYSNADEIGKFIDSVKNSGTMFQTHMKAHIDTLVATILAYVAKDYTNDIKHNDEYMSAGLRMAFMM